MNLRIAKRAQRDLEAIIEHIAAHNLAAAEELNDDIHKAIEVLAQFPGLGHNRDDVSNKRYFFWSVRGYVIAYRKEPPGIVIVRVVHGARDLGRMFS